MNILGISDVTGNHSQSSIALLQDGTLTFALAQERISRVKNDPRFPVEAIQTALDYTHLRLSDIDYFACAYPPANYYKSLMQYSSFDLPRSFIGAMLRSPRTISKYLGPNMKKTLVDAKKSNGLLQMGVPEEKFQFVDHHLAHVMAGYYASPFDEALLISYGGFAPHETGKNVAGALYRCRDGVVEFLEDIPMFAGGTFFSGAAVALGMRYMQQEGKVMGMAATGDYHECYGRVHKLASYFRQDHWTKYKYWVDYVMSPRADAFLSTRTGRKLSKLIRQHGPANVAAAVQHVWEKSVVRLIKYYINKYKVHALVLTGGTFQNIKVNSLIGGLDEVADIFVHPHPGDGSTAIGAAVEMSRRAGEKPQKMNLTDTGLGVDFNDTAIELAIRRFASMLVYRKLGEPSTYAAGRIAEGKIIAWFQGREEYGPRSLGHRCILARPDDIELRNRINRDIKGREIWVPMTASILAEKGSELFADFVESPFAERTFHAKRGNIRTTKAVTHDDGSVRVQSVSRQAYRPLRKLLQSFQRRTGLPMVLNTSLNKHGEPIVHRPVEALQMLLDSPIDELIIGSFSVKKGIVDDK